MALLDELRRKVAADEFEFSQHALDHTLHRNITVAEVREAVQSCELIGDHPQDKYGPSCLLLGWTQARRPLHVQCSYPSRPLVIIITLYEPDPDLWMDFRERKP